MIDLYGNVRALALVGQELGVSSWTPVGQDRITRFGHLTDDPDPVHIDPDWARDHSPFGETIAFGFLTLALLTSMVNQVITRPDDEVSTLNYGFDRLRLLSPVRVGRRVRGRFVLKDLRLRTPTQFRVTLGVQIDIEHESRPALVADWLILTNVVRPRSLQGVGAAT